MQIPFILPICMDYKSASKRATIACELMFGAKLPKMLGYGILRYRNFKVALQRKRALGGGTPNALIERFSRRARR
jgi:hypothetical protein